MADCADAVDDVRAGAVSSLAPAVAEVVALAVASASATARRMTGPATDPEAPRENGRADAFAANGPNSELNFRTPTQPCSRLAGDPTPEPAHYGTFPKRGQEPGLKCACFAAEFRK